MLAASAANMLFLAAEVMSVLTIRMASATTRPFALFVRSTWSEPDSTTMLVPMVAQDAPSAVMPAGGTLWLTVVENRVTVPSRIEKGAFVADVELPSQVAMIL